MNATKNQLRAVSAFLHSQGREVTIFQVARWVQRMQNQGYGSGQEICRTVLARDGAQDYAHSTLKAALRRTFGDPL